MYTTFTWTEHARLPSSTGCECQESWITEIAVFGKAALHLGLSGYECVSLRGSLSFWTEIDCRKRMPKLGTQTQHEQGWINPTFHPMEWHPHISSTSRLELLNHKLTSHCGSQTLAVQQTSSWSASLENKV